MGKLYAIISGIVGSGFGIGKIWSLFGKVKLAKKLVKELKEAYGEFDDILPAVMNFKASAREVLADKKVTKEEAMNCVREGYKVAKEVEEFVKEAKDVIAIFK